MSRKFTAGNCMTATSSVTVFEYSYWSLSLVLFLVCSSIAFCYFVFRSFRNWRAAVFSKARRETRNWLFACIFFLLWISLLTFHWTAIEGTIFRGLVTGRVAVVAGEIEFLSCHRIAKLQLLHDPSTYLSRSCSGFQSLAIGDHVALRYVKGFYGDNEIIQLSIKRKEVP